MQKDHHGDTHVYAPDSLRCLLEVIVLHCDRDKLTRFAGLSIGNTRQYLSQRPVGGVVPWDPRARLDDSVSICTKRQSITMVRTILEHSLVVLRLDLCSNSKLVNPSCCVGTNQQRFPPSAGRRSTRQGRGPERQHTQRARS